MTPTQIEQAARERYNSVGSTFWSQSEIFSLIYSAQMDLVNRTHVIEKTFQITVTQGTQEYELPATVIAVKRATYDGMRLDPVNFQDDDIITAYNADTTEQGNSRYFWVWNNSINLRPIPSSSTSILKIWTHNIPETVTATGELDVHPMFHTWIIDYVVSFMVAKDENHTLARYYMDLWENHITHSKSLISKNKTSKGFNFVRDEDSTNITWVGSL